MQISLVQSFLTRLLSTLLRFAPAVLCCAVFTLLVWDQIDGRPGFAVDETSAGICIVGVFWFLALKLLGENRKVNAVLTNLIALTGFAAIATFIYLETTSVSWQFVVAFLALTMAAPSAMWVFNYRACLGFLFSGLITAILGAGVMVIMASLKYLFDVDLELPAFLKLGLVLSGFVWPLLTMMHIPKDASGEPNEVGSERLRLLVEYVLAPLWLVYVLLLNAYAVRIAALQTLPRGKVSIMVLLLGLAAFVTYFLADNGKEPGSLPNRVFRKYFGWFMIAPLVFMGIGLANRIQDYGLTEPRYLNALALLIMTLAVLHSFLRSKENLVRFILVLIAVLLPASTFGPWGSVSLSERHQISRLKAILERNQVLVNNEMRLHHPPLTDDELVKVKSSLEFLWARKRRSAIREWFPKEDQVLFDQDLYGVNDELGQKIDLYLR